MRVHLTCPGHSTYYIIQFNIASALYVAIPCCFQLGIRYLFFSFSLNPSSFLLPPLHSPLLFSYTSLNHGFHIFFFFLNKVVIQSLNCAVSLRLHELQHAPLRCPSLSPTVYSNSCPLSQWCHLNISSSVIPFSCLQSFPASGSFPMSWLFTSGGQSGASASASVLPGDIQGDFL